MTTSQQVNDGQTSKKMPRLKRIFKNLRQGMDMAWSAAPKPLLQYTFLGIIGSGLTPLFIYLSALLVNRIAEAHRHLIEFQDTILILLALWAIVVIQRAAGAHVGYGRTLFVRRVELEAERRLLVKAATVDLAHFENSDWHDRLSRAKRDVSWRPGDLTWAIINLAGYIVSVLFMLSLLATLHYVLVIFAIVGAVVSLILESRVSSKMYAFYYGETTEQRERDYLGNLLIQARMAKEIRAYELPNYLLRRYNDITDRLFKQREQLFVTSARISGLSGVISGTMLAAAYFFVTLKGISGLFDPGGVVLVIGAFSAVAAAFSQISSAFLAIDQHTAFLEDYFSFLEIQPLVRPPKNPQKLPKKLSEGIQLKDVTFTYQGGTKPAVAGLNLHIHDGELIALVGTNGSGKSTLVKLLLRFYDIDQGSIQIGGVDLRELHTQDLRDRIGVMFQDHAGYELSIRENVIMGRPDHDQIGDERIVEALRDSQIDGLVDSMPNGLDSKVGRLFEGGHDLSGGEWQRLALARLMYRNADIWILDEPTASLDPEAEAAIFAELKENLKGRIGIVISHRFSTVRIADRIAVISAGCITEVGTHNELIDAKGQYASLFELQASGYR